MKPLSLLRYDLQREREMEYFNDSTFLENRKSHEFIKKKWTVERGEGAIDMGSLSRCIDIKCEP